MIIAYSVIGKKIKKIEMKAGDKVPRGTVWLDLIEPSIDEERYIEQTLSVNAPTKEEMDKIEVRSPFYKEGNAYYMTVTILNKQEADYADGMAITFILTKNCLITVRYGKPKSFQSFSARVMRNPELCKTPELALEGLVETIVHRIGDTLEHSGNEIDNLVKTVFNKTSTKQNKESDFYDNIIKNIGQTGNVISKNRESLVSLNRLLIFFSQIENSNKTNKKEHRIKFKTLAREVHALAEYVNFLLQRNSFLLDATLGMISVEQNVIVKLFTVAAAVFMPPTLFASIWGMNFHNMPELDWALGYPIALIMIIISAIFPYLYFKRKGWL